MKNQIFKILAISGLILLLLSGGSDLFAKPSKFKVLVLTERGGQHEGFVVAALDWLKTYSAEKNFEITVINHAKEINETMLANYKVFIQLNYPQELPIPGAKKPKRRLSNILKKDVVVGSVFIMPLCWASLMATQCGTGFPILWAASVSKITSQQQLQQK